MSCTGSALDLHLSDVSLAPLDKELDEQDGSDLGPTGKNDDTWRSSRGVRGWLRLSFQESLSGSRVGEVPSPSPRPLQPRLGSLPLLSLPPPERSGPHRDGV